MPDGDGAGPTWRKSSRSTQVECVEVRFIDGTVEVRNSRDTTGPVLSFTPAEWVAFLGGVQLGEFQAP